jgi:catechol 2,3-dioxygenase-like lactoylglutathione lyase family enzyme
VVESTFKAVINAEQHHTAIRVRDVVKMMSFYGETMGLPYIRQVDDAQGPKQVWYQAVQLIRADGTPDPAAGTMDHLAVSVLNIEKIAERLTKAGTVLESSILHSDHPALGLHLDNVFFRDPEGNRVELVQWVPLRR